MQQWIINTSEMLAYAREQADLDADDPFADEAQHRQAQRTLRKVKALAAQRMTEMDWPDALRWVQAVARVAGSLAEREAARRSPR